MLFMIWIEGNKKDMKKIDIFWITFDLDEQKGIKNFYIYGTWLYILCIHDLYDLYASLELLYHK